MNAKSQYLIQVLEKIGAPLLSSIVEISAGPTPAEDNGAHEAQRMAELLTRTTQASLEIANVISAANATQDDAFRLSLAALASPIIADHYRYDRQVPGDADIKKITAALQTVVTFSDNFEADEKNGNALQNLDGGVNGADPNQVSMQQIAAFTPIVNAVGSFSFGMNEPKLISDIAARLVQKSLSLSGQWFGDASEAHRKKSAVEILKVLARIYAVCHQTETARMQQAGGEGGGLESVWRNFDLRVALLEALAGGLLDSATTGKAPAVETAATAAPPPAVTTAPASTPAAAQVPPAGGGFNPMGGFAKKPEGEAPPPPASPFTPATPPSQPPAQASGGGFNPMGGFAKKPDGAPPAPPPVNPSQPVEKPANPPSNPMGFFKKSDE